MLKEKLLSFLKGQQFVTLGSSTPEGSPHASPKIFLKMEGKNIYLIDYLVGVSFENIKANKEVSISTFDIQEVKGFHVYGQASILRNGPEYEALLKEWDVRQTQTTAKNISEVVRGEKNKKVFKLTFKKPVEIYKIKIKRIDFVNTQGVLMTDRL